MKKSARRKFGKFYFLLGTKHGGLLLCDPDHIQNGSEYSRAKTLFLLQQKWNDAKYWDILKFYKGSELICEVFEDDKKIGNFYFDRRKTDMSQLYTWDVNNIGANYEI